MTLFVPAFMPITCKRIYFVAWEAPWRESKTAEPADNVLEREHRQSTRLQRAVNVEIASLHAIPVAETVYNVRRQQGPFETSPIRRPSPAGYRGDRVRRSNRGGRLS